MSGPQVRVKTRDDIRRQRRSRRHRCWDHLIAAPLWPMHGANLGTLLRTCDAVGACLAVPRLPGVPEALARGNTLRRPACVHWTGWVTCPPPGSGLARFRRPAGGGRRPVSRPAGPGELRQRIMSRGAAGQAAEALGWP